MAKSNGILNKALVALSIFTPLFDATGAVRGGN